MEKAAFRTLCLAFLLISASVFSQGGSNFLGQVLYHDNYPISGVNAYLHTSSGSVIDTAVTDVNGFYEFQNVTPGTYTITFSTSQPEGGIELSDAYLVMLHLFNMYPFDEIEFLAADVNGSNTITWLDYSLIVIGYLNQGNPFPIGPWVFESITTPIPDNSRDYVRTGGGSSSGDVNGSLQPDPKGTSIFVQNPIVEMNTRADSPVDFTIDGGQDLNLTGMHLSLVIPQDIELIDVETPFESANIHISGNLVNITWLDTTQQVFTVNEGSSIVVMHTRSKKHSRNSDSFKIKLGPNSHFIDANGNLIHGVNLIMPTLELKYVGNFTASAYPNPFIDHLTIEYFLKLGGNVSIDLYDHAGRLVYARESTNQPEGTYQHKIDGRSLLPGIYHYAVSVTGEEQNVFKGTIIKSK